jgi:adenylosuccinate synthase
MHAFTKLYQQVYRDNLLFGLDTATPLNLVPAGKRANSVAVVGGALGDEGKGRVTDELTAHFLKTHGEVIHYRDNGGANAGHTVVVGKIKIALHQLGSGILQKGCTIVLGKEMVLHPEDLVTELEMVKTATGGTIPAQVLIDEQTVLSLDTHRAFEAALKNREAGGKGSTGRGIAPAYADVLYRHPVRIRDLTAQNWRKKLVKHYQLYADLIDGLGSTLSEQLVPRLIGENIAVGSEKEFLARLEQARETLLPLCADVHEFLKTAWSGTTPFVFEKAQALGLDLRWGVYPDVTASNCGFDGILSSTEGVVNPQAIALKAATLKATYTSSVGSRQMPTVMDEKLAHRIREDANEYGATTKRPRDIIHIDLPMLSFLCRVGGVEQLVLTHLDIAYPEVPIKVCVAYKQGKKTVGYRPDQEFLNTVTPEYIELPSWDGKALVGVSEFAKLPQAAQQYCAFISQALETELLMVTTGAKRREAVRWL